MFPPQDIDTAQPRTQKVQYVYSPQHLANSEPNKFTENDLKNGKISVNLGPQHPSTHGVLRLEVLTDGEFITDIAPHIGYLHRCFEKHCEKLNYAQIIPYIDRMDYVSAMNSEHVYAMAVEKMLGITDQIPKRVEYIRVLVAELNRLASHFVALGTYGVDIGATTPFLWLMRDREHILRLLEWLTGARMLYNYIWIGGLYYDLPVGFEEKCKEFLDYLTPKIKETENLMINNKIFIARTANVGVISLELAVNYALTGAIMRASGLKMDLRKKDAYSVYSEIDFDVPVGVGAMGKQGDCWDRTWVRLQECYESIKILHQCIEKLLKEHKRTPDFNPQSAIPKKIRPEKQFLYFRGETPKGELGFFLESDGKSDIPLRCKVRSPCFVNLSVLPAISKGVLFSDLIAIIGSLDFVMGEVDR